MNSSCVPGGYCGFPPTIENGYVAMATGVQGGDETWYQCNPGFEAITSTNITCQSNNQWEPPPQCFCKYKQINHIMKQPEPMKEDT